MSQILCSVISIAPLSQLLLHDHVFCFILDTYTPDSLCSFADIVYVKVYFNANFKSEEMCSLGTYCRVHSIPCCAPSWSCIACCRGMILHMMQCKTKGLWRATATKTASDSRLIPLKWKKCSRVSKYSWPACIHIYVHTWQVSLPCPYHCLTHLSSAPSSRTYWRGFTAFRSWRSCLE